MPPKGGWRFSFTLDLTDEWMVYSSNLSLPSEAWHTGNGMYNSSYTGDRRSWNQTPQKIAEKHLFGCLHRVPVENVFYLTTACLFVCLLTPGVFKSTKRQASPTAAGWRSRGGRREAVDWGGRWDTQTPASSGCTLTWTVRREDCAEFHFAVIAIYQNNRNGHVDLGASVQHEITVYVRPSYFCRYTCYISPSVLPSSSRHAVGCPCRWDAVCWTDRGAQRLPCPLQSAESPGWQVVYQQPNIILFIMDQLSVVVYYGGFPKKQLLTWFQK